MQLQLTIITPERRLSLSNLRQVIFQSPQGETGVLPGHAALVSLCTCGIVRAFSNESDANDPPQCFVVGNGSVRAFDDHLVLLTKRLRCEDELETDDAHEALDEVTATLGTLDPYLDQEEYHEWLKDANFYEAVLSLDREVLQRRVNLTK